MITGELPPDVGFKAWSAESPICIAKVFTPNSTPMNRMFAQKPIAKPIKNSLKSINVKAGTEFGVTNEEFVCTLGNNMNAITAANQILTCVGIGYVENNGAEANNPDNLVKIAMNKIMLPTENNTSRLNIT